MLYLIFEWAPILPPSHYYFHKNIKFYFNFLNYHLTIKHNIYESIFRVQGEILLFHERNLLLSWIEINFSDSYLLKKLYILGEFLVIVEFLIIKLTFLWLLSKLSSFSDNSNFSYKMAVSLKKNLILILTNLKIEAIFYILKDPALPAST